MKKQIITALLITSIAISGIFATDYSAPNVILTASKAQQDYSFKVQEISNNTFIDSTTDLTKVVTLNPTPTNTNSFTVATTADGNMPNDITFKIDIATGEFLGSDDSSITSGWFPMIIEQAEEANDKNIESKNSETLYYSEGYSDDFSQSNTGTFRTTFSRGKHLLDTEVARFQLQYRADDNLVAGSYTSTTSISISVEN